MMQIAVKSTDTGMDEYLKAVKDIKKYSEAPECKENPFVPMLSPMIELKRKVSGAENSIGKVTIINDDTGEVTSGDESRVFTEKKYVDNDKFIKVYQGQLKAMFALNGAAIKVFGYFIYEMQGSNGKDKDMVYFNVQECMEFCQYTGHSQVYNGLTELLRKAFIAISPRQNFFYVNPLYAFNGNRIMIYEEYIRKDGLKKAGESRQIEQGSDDEW